MGSPPFLRIIGALSVFVSIIPKVYYLSNPIAKCSNMSERMRLGVELISVENVKPAAPTPDHLRFYNLSHFDQFYQKFYMSSIYFYLISNHHQQQCSEMINHDALSLKRRQDLKKSLSETLTMFYPLAGMVHDDFIDCNNEGVYYVEAKVNVCLSDFLNQGPQYKSMHQLLPFVPSSKELLSQTYMVMIQVTVFSCGGIAIGLYNSHKLMDGFSHGSFMKAWASTTRGFPRSICPSYTSPSIFPSNPSQKLKTLEETNPFYSRKTKSMTRRLVFSASSLTKLKTMTGSSRVVAVTCLIWKCVMAAKLRSSLDSSRPKSYTLAFILDLRTRSSPPLPPYSIGNIIWPALAKYEANDNIGELGSITGLLKNAIEKINSEFIDTMKGENGAKRVEEYLKETDEFYGGNYDDSVSVSSLCNSGIYEMDFGWGKPIWIAVGDAGADVPALKNIVVLYDTRSGGGIEAWVTLTEEDMVIFESNPELLVWASLDPSPLRMIKDDTRRPVYCALIKLLQEKDLCVRLVASRSLYFHIEDANFSEPDFVDLLPICWDSCFKLIEEVQEFDSKVQVLNTISSLIANISEVIPYANKLVQFFQKAWEESSGQSLLQIQLLTALKNFVVALNCQSPICYNTLLPILQSVINVNSPDELLEDSMQLWEATISHATTMVPQLLGYFPCLVEILDRSFDHLKVAAGIIEGYIILGGLEFLNMHATTLAKLLDLVVSNVNDKGLLSILPLVDVLVQCFPAEVPQLISTTIQKLIVICLSGGDEHDPSKTAVKASSAAILARILVMNTNYLAQLTSESSLLEQLQTVGFPNEENILFCLVDVWLDKVDNVIFTQRKTFGLALSLILTLRLPQVLDKLDLILSVCTSVIMGGSEDLTEEEESSSDNMQSSKLQIPSKELRRRQIKFSDPVNQISLQNSVRDNLQTCAALHGESFNTAISRMHPAAFAQLKHALNMP